MLLVEDTCSFGKAVIRGLLLRDDSVVRVNERIMYVKLVVGKQIVTIVSAYDPQVGLSAEEKESSGTDISLCSHEFLSMIAFSFIAN